MDLELADATAETVTEAILKRLGRKSHVGLKQLRLKVSSMFLLPTFYLKNPHNLSS